MFNQFNPLRDNSDDESEHDSEIDTDEYVNDMHQAIAELGIEVLLDFDENDQAAYLLQHPLTTEDYTRLLNDPENRAL